MCSSDLVTNYASLEIGEVVPVGIRDLLEDAMDGIDKGLEAIGQTVEWDAFCPDQTVFVDPRLSVLAFEAIMQNCVDFTNGKAKVKVTVAPGRLACVVKVTDFGSGIIEDDLSHVYDPFFSLKPKGSGMGLCIVRKVAMEHQWDLAIESTLGEGTTVSIVIPRRELTGLGS